MYQLFYQLNSEEQLICRISNQIYNPILYSLLFFLHFLYLCYVDVSNFERIPTRSVIEKKLKVSLNKKRKKEIERGWGEKYLYMIQYVLIWIETQTTSHNFEIEC